MDGQKKINSIYLKAIIEDYVNNFKSQKIDGLAFN